MEEAINKNVDIIALSLNHFRLNNGLVAPVFRLALQMFWKEFIEEYLADPQRIYEILSEDPEVKAILDTCEGRDYLNRCCEASYESLYNFAWQGFGA